MGWVADLQHFGQTDFECNIGAICFLPPLAKSNVHEQLWLKLICTGGVFLLDVCTRGVFPLGGMSAAHIIMRMQAIGTDSADAAGSQGFAIVHDIERAVDLSLEDLDDLDARCLLLQGAQQKLCIGKALMQYREKLLKDGSPNRVTQQTFEHWEHFLQANHWEAMKHNPEQAYDVAGAILSQLGLKNPREPTSQKVAAVLALNEVGYAKAMQMSEDELQRIYKKVKDTLIAYGKMPADRPAITTFPQTAALYLRENTAYAVKVYEHGPPVTCPFQADHIACIRGKINMRKKPNSGVLQLSPFDLGVSTQFCMQDMKKQLLEFGSQLVKKQQQSQSMQERHEVELLELKQTLVLQQQQQYQRGQQQERQMQQQPSQKSMALEISHTSDEAEPIEQETKQKPIEQTTKPKPMAQVTSDLVLMLADGKGAPKAKGSAKKQPTTKAKAKGNTKATASGKAAKKEPVKKAAKKGVLYKHML